MSQSPVPESNPSQGEFLDALPESAAGIRFSISLLGVSLGLLAGIALGWLYTMADPVILRNVEPENLRPEDKEAYVAAIALEYSAHGDLLRAFSDIQTLEPGSNSFEIAAETACELSQEGKVQTLSDMLIIRNLRDMYESQGIQAPCDLSFSNTAIPVIIVSETPTVTFTPSITPIATKTPTQVFKPRVGNTPIPASTPLTSPDGTIFREAYVEQFCDSNNSGVIEIYVRDTSGQGLPGMPVQVTWGIGERQVFYTGLKPDRGDEYADFEMEPGNDYRVSILNEGEASRILEAVPCNESGTIRSYRVVMQRFFND